MRPASWHRPAEPHSHTSRPNQTNRPENLTEILFGQYTANPCSSCYQTCLPNWMPLAGRGTHCEKGLLAIGKRRTLDRIVRPDVLDGASDRTNHQLPVLLHDPMITSIGQYVLAVAQSSGHRRMGLATARRGGLRGEDHHRSIAKLLVFTHLHRTDWQIFQLACDGDRKFRLHPENGSHRPLARRQRKEPRALHRPGLRGRASADESHEGTAQTSRAASKQKCDKSNDPDPRQNRCSATDPRPDLRLFAVMLGRRIPFLRRDRIDKHHPSHFIRKARSEQRHRQPAKLMAH